MEAPHLPIKRWLDSGQDYAQGVQLAQAHGIAPATLKLLQSGQNTYTRGKLRDVLSQVLDQLSSQANVPAPAAVRDTLPTAPGSQAPVSPELAQLRARRLATFKLANHHFGLMRVAPEGAPRLEHALAIKKLMRENAQLWDDERYYEQFGFLPMVAPAPALDLTDLRAVERRRNNLRTYLSGAKKQTRGKADPNAVATWTAELNHLNRVLVYG